MVAPTLLNYPLHRATLPNGLRVVVSPDHTAPVVAVNLWYDVGSRDELPGRTGFAHLFEHLMFQGSGRVGSGEHLAAIQAAGGTCNATTWFDRTNYFEAVPTGALDLALWLEADRLASLLDAVNQDNLDNQRDVVQEEKRQRYDNAPYGNLLELLLALAFPAGHPYAHPTIGSMADLDAASLSDVHAFFRTWYAPDNAVLTLVGDVEPADAVARVERYFGAIPARGIAPRPVPATLPALSGVPRAQTAAAVPASALYLTWRLPVAGTRAYDACDLALQVLGGSQTSRAYRRLVRDGGLASGAGASALPLLGGASLGYAFGRALDGVGLDAVESALVEEIDRLASEGPTEEELERVKIQFERAWLSECARVESRADLISAFTTAFDEPERINSRVAAYASLTRDEVTEAVRTHLHPDRRAVLAYERGIPQEDR